MALKKMRRVDRNVIGVIQDLNRPFNQPEQPVKIKLSKESTHNWICFRVEEVDIRSTVKWIEQRMHAKGSRGNAFYFNQQFEIWLNYQDQLNALSRILTIIPVLLAGFAIYGLTVSLVRDKVKEIAVHHLFGARMSDVTRLLCTWIIEATVYGLCFFWTCDLHIAERASQNFYICDKILVGGFFVSSDILSRCDYRTMCLSSVQAQSK